MGFGIMIFLLGFNIIIFYIRNLQRLKDFKKDCTIETTAIVVNILYRGQEDKYDSQTKDIEYLNGYTPKSNAYFDQDEQLYIPVFLYTIDGTIYKVKDSNYYSDQYINKGQTVTIKYCPFNPKKFYVLELDNTYKIPFLCFILGAVFILFGIYLMFAPFFKHILLVLSSYKF